MNYLLMIYENEQMTAQFTDEERQKILDGYGTFTQKILGQGIMEGGNQLTPTSSATTVRVREGKVLTTDGPFAETKEQITGYYLIKCNDLDQAIEIATQMPSVTYGSIEIRPIHSLNS